MDAQAGENEMRTPDRRHLNKGFSLGELLVSVAIIAILAAIAIPAVIAVRKNLKFAELNDTAREIYISVQNKLVGEKATGELDTLKTLANNEFSDHNLTDMPKDFFTLDSNDAEAWKNLFYMESSAPGAMETYLVDTVSLEKSVLDGSFIVEFDPTNGSVYSVFYAEKPISYADVKNLDRTQDALRNHSPMLGYYGGKLDSTSASDLPKFFDVTVQHVNGEELYLSFTCDNLLQLIRAQDHLTVTVTLTDTQDETKQSQIVLTGLKDFTIQSQTMTFQPILLDSLTNHFAELYPALADGVRAGHSFKADVKVRFSYNSILIENKEVAETTFNSLFTDDSTDAALGVGCIRHLNNLRGDYYQAPGDVTITQRNAIDFQKGEFHWRNNRYLAKGTTCPISSFTPVTNTSLDGRAVYDGAGNALKNFVVTASGANTGLFGTVNGWSFRNVSIADPRITGTASVGSLAGSATGCSIANSGVYLSTKDDDGGLYYEQTAENADAYANRMDERRAALTVTGTSAVGGLVGYEKNCTITNSFAAIDVTGTSAVGGLAGRMEGGSVTGSYASGDALAGAGSSAGGLAGTASAVTADSCYATSDVIAASGAGGFVGTASGGTYRSCTAYGRITKSDGTQDKTASGGFIGTGSASCTGCVFLLQKGYNEGYAARSGVEGKYYKDLLYSGTRIVGDPYNVNLYSRENCVFPFAPLSGQTAHHGDWPMEYTILVAMVYYERYTNGSYGLYALTSLSNGETVSGSTDNTRWLLNTLKDNQPCVEDGYALMSIYQLSKFRYQLNDETTSHDVTIAAAAGSGKAVLLKTEKTLSFSKVTLNASGQPTRDATGNIVVDSSAASLNVSGLYIYQLEYNLQDTNRNTSSAFYDKFRLVSAEGIGDSTSLLNDYVFYYNPHFAKNALNPDPYGKNVTEKPGDTEISDKIFVRSARQLNAIGRYAYYWNHGNNKTGKAVFYFEQEIDIDFSIYIKGYCGNTSFNLMSTDSDNAYRNRPIGRPNNQEFKDPNGIPYKPSQFQNTYDGQCRKIIDYCVECSENDDYQFVGLFGEVRNATLKNIVMTASNPSQSTGYVKSYYGGGVDGKHAGAGVLAGLIYRAVNSDVTTVTNCAVSGYTIFYSGKTYSAVGGLVGFNMGTITNCSAVSYLASARPTNSGKNTQVGGLAGINMSVIKNCYAGGNLKIEAYNSDSTNINTESGIGGIAGKIYSIWNEMTGDNREWGSIQSSYSYCAPSTDNMKRISYYGIAPNGDASSSTYCKGQYVSGCYYLTSSVSNALTLKDTAGTVTRYNYKNLAGLWTANRANAANSHPWNTQNGAYPFPAVVKNASGAYVHYGSWPQETAAGGLFVYYEKYADGIFGYYYLDGDGTSQSSLLGNRELREAGYGYLAAPGIREVTLTAGGSSYTGAKQGTADAVSLTQTFTNGTVRSFIYNTLFTFPDEAAAAMTPTASAAGSAGEPDVEITVGSLGYLASGSLSADSNYSYRLYVNAGFSAAIAARENRLGIAEDFQIRRQEDLAEISALSKGLPEAYLSYSQTRSFTVDDSEAGLVELAKFDTYDGGRNTITGLRQPLFASVKGSVQNVALSGSAVNAEAVFTLENSGTIRSSSVRNAEIAADSDCAVFVYENSGAISGCEAAGSDIYSGGGSAAGFVSSNSANGTIADCSAAPATIEGKNAAGFAYNNAGEITGCAASAGESITGAADAAGFTAVCSGSGTIRQCSATIGQTLIAETGTAAGFVLSSTGRAEITGCTVGGNGAVISQSGDACGFAWLNGQTAQSTASLTDCSVSGVTVSAPDASAAGFVGTNSVSASVSGCGASNVTVTASADAAGFALDNSGSLENSTANGMSITGTSFASGFFTANSGTVSDCGASGSVTAESGKTGTAAGFGGQNSGTVSRCSASAVATGVYASGFAHENTGSIEYCSVTGAQILADGTAAGFINSNENSVTGCTVSAAVGLAGGGTGKAAGFVWSNDGKISDSDVLQAATVTGHTAAGFAGTGSGTLENCTYWENGEQITFP